MATCSSLNLPFSDEEVNALKAVLAKEREREQEAKADQVRDAIVETLEDQQDAMNAVIQQTINDQCVQMVRKLEAEREKSKCGLVEAIGCVIGFMIVAAFVGVVSASFVYEKTVNTLIRITPDLHPVLSLQNATRYETHAMMTSLIAKSDKLTAVLNQFQGDFWWTSVLFLIVMGAIIILIVLLSLELTPLKMIASDAYLASYNSNKQLEQSKTDQQSLITALTKLQGDVANISSQLAKTTPTSTLVDIQPFSPEGKCPPGTESSADGLWCIAKQS